MIKKISLVILGLLLFAVLGRLLYVHIQQKNDFDYHLAIPKTISVQSGDFVQNGLMPVECTGKGNNLSPSLRWSNIPQNTQSLVILVTDYDAPAPYLKLNTVDHWILYNISPQITTLEKGIADSVLKSEKVEAGRNISGTLEYIGPKPPLGTHSYYFRVYALSVSHLKLTKPNRDEVMSAMKNYVIAYGELIGKF